MENGATRSRPIHKKRNKARLSVAVLAILGNGPPNYRAEPILTPTGRNKTLAMTKSIESSETRGGHAALHRRM